MIRAVVADDEPLAQEELTHLIEADREFQIVGRARNGKEALDQIRRGHADVVFLDIEMPGLNGLEVASRLAEWQNPPLVIFATAYDRYAIDAFETHAIDYILKPYESKRLTKTFEHVRERLKAKRPTRESLLSLEDYLIRKGTLKKLVGHRRNSKDRAVIDPSEVHFFSAKLSEVLARVGDEELIVNSTLKEVLAQLEPTRFVQTHKSYVVNLDQVEKVSPLFSGNFQITLRDPKLPKIPVSRRFAKKLKGSLPSW